MDTEKRTPDVRTRAWEIIHDITKGKTFDQSCRAIERIKKENPDEPAVKKAAVIFNRNFEILKKIITDEYRQNSYAKQAAGSI